MRYIDIVAKVKEREGVSEQRADAVTKATVRALAEVVPSHQMRRLAEQLPVELKHVVEEAVPREQNSLDDVVRRISEMTGADTIDVHTIKAVVGTLAETVNYPFKDLFAQLPPEFDDLIPTPQPRRPIDEFLAQVQQAAGIDSREQAEQAVHATLRTLSERISGGQAKDLAVYLPAAVRTELMAASEEAEPFGREEFVDRIAAIESIDRPTAERHARAVLTAVRDSVPKWEVADTLDQLPSDIARLTR